MRLIGPTDAIFDRFMPDVLDREALRAALKVMVVEICMLQIPPDRIEDDEQLIAGRLDINSLDAIEIASAVDYAWQVWIEDVRGARSIMRSIGSLAEHIALEKGWPR